jgi:hypothetical protein
MRIKPDECEAIGYIVLREDGTTQQLLTRLEEHLLALQEDLSRLEKREWTGSAPCLIPWQS